MITHLSYLEHLLYKCTCLNRKLCVHLLESRKISCNQITAFQPVIALYMHMTGIIIIIVGLELKLTTHT